MSLIYSSNCFKITHSCMQCWAVSRAYRQIRIQGSFLSNINKKKNMGHFLARMCSSNSSKSSGSFQIFDLVNKDRLILFGFGSEFLFIYIFYIDFFINAFLKVYYGFFVYSLFKVPYKDNH